LRVVLLLLLGARVCSAGWDFTNAGDPNRNWGVSAMTAGQYDDNWQSSESNRQSGPRVDSDIKFRANIPFERLFMGLQYDYSALYPEDVHNGGVTQTHSLNATANYTVTPRLALNLNENFVSSLQPGLVQGPNGVPISLSSEGNYIYDTVGGGANYVLTPRWTAAVSGSWDIWEYQTSSIASNNNHQDYTATLSALYALDTRTTVGLNYQYSQNIFVNPGPGSGLNGYSQTVYLSAVRRFNPRLSLTLNGGYTVRNSEDGSQNTSPSGLAALVYNYGPLSSVTLTIAQSLTEASVGTTRSFSAQENSSVALQVNHRITAKLHAEVDGTYVYTTLTAPLETLQGTNVVQVTFRPNEQGLTGHVNCSYTFRDWLSASFDYWRTQLSTSDSFLIQPYSRNQVSLGMTLTY
jgi:hypothetical protein